MNIILVHLIRAHLCGFLLFKCASIWRLLIYKKAKLFSKLSIIETTLSRAVLNICEYVFSVSSIFVCPNYFATNVTLANAILDRLLRYSHVININGNSYRLKDKIKIDSEVPETTHSWLHKTYIFILTLTISININISYSLDHLEMPLKANYNPDNYRLYFGDTGLLIGSLDEESQKDLRNNQNFGTYKGAIFENIIAEMLTKAGFDLFFYRDEQNKIEMDFIIRDEQNIIPVEVKSSDNATYSLNRLLEEKQYKNIMYGIKLCNKNIGFNGKFYTFPYFMTFLLKRFLEEKK